jgi:transcriptional regulator with XRE-family HTH domain
MSGTAKPLAQGTGTSAVLTKAVARAAERLGISRAALARILGVSPATVTRLFRGEYKLDERRKQWEFALLFVRLFRSLDSIVGDEQSARRWLGSDNRVLNARPIDLLHQTEGLVRVVQYLDASRGSAWCEWPTVTCAPRSPLLTNR